MHAHKWNVTIFERSQWSYNPTYCNCFKWIHIDVFKRVPCTFLLEQEQLYTSDFHSDDFIQNCIDVDSALRDRHLWVIQPQEGVILPEGFTKPRCPGVLLVSAASPYQQLFSWAARGILLDTMGFRKISLPMRKTKPQIVREIIG